MSNWLEVGRQVAQAGLPLLGNVLGGPAGAKVGAVVASFLGTNDDPKAVAAALQGNPDALVALRRLESDERVKLTRLVLAAETAREEHRAAQLAEVNATMRREAASEHWPQWSWRPYNGFLFGTTLFCVYFLLPLVGREVPEIPEWVWMAWAAVLGVTAWHRGVQKRVREGEQIPTLRDRVAGWLPQPKGTK